MRKTLIIIGIILISTKIAVGQSRSELEEIRKKNLQEIEYVNKMLKSTATKKNESINELRIIGKKLNLREKLINEYGEEIDLLEYRIELNTLAEDMLEDDLETVRKEYEKSIVSAYKSTKGTPALAFILSSTDINQGYKRLKYIQQIAKYRRNETETIETLYKEIKSTKESLEKDRLSINDLKKKEIRQRQMLREEKSKQENMINSLSRKEKQLKQELEEKKKIAKRIEKEIERLVEEESRSSAGGAKSTEMKLLSENFVENKGRLPWPVESGIITSHYGLQKHPVLPNVTEDNIGIEITTNGKAEARAVFNGEVVRVFAISGANMAVIIRHGKYLSVYQNLVEVKVNPGEKVKTGQGIGKIYLDNSGDGKAVIKFMIYEEKKKLDPELWLIKK